MRALLFVILAALVLAACTSDGCYDNSSALPKAAFYQDGKQVSVKALTVRGLGAPGDSLLIDSTATTEFYLPMPLSATSVTWVLDYNTEGAENDTLTIGYDPVMSFVSRDCGAMYFYRILNYSCTRHSIDSVAVPDSLITNVDRISLRLHLYSAQP